VPPVNRSSRKPPVTPAPENISPVDIIAAPRTVAECARRTWDARMLRFLLIQRRRGKPVRWIAGRLGLDLRRVVAMAVNLRLTLPSAYRGRKCKTRRRKEPKPLGPPGDIADEGLCRWIEADPQGPWAMCARPALHGYAYCRHHKTRAYLPRRPPVSTNIAATAPRPPAPGAGAGAGGRGEH
jgi:hypothetical protein